MSHRSSLILVCMLFASTLAALVSGSPPARADTQAPTITPVNPPTFLTTGDDFTLNATVIDDVGVRNAWVEYWWGAGTHDQKDMTKIAGLSEYYAILTAPLNSLDELHYILYADDAAGNTGSTPEKTLTVLDNKYPTLDAERTPADATTGEYSLFDIDVSDNIGILDVNLRWHYTGTTSFQKQLMTKVSSTTYQYNFLVPGTSKKSVVYYYEIRDKNPQTTNTPEKTMVVHDNDLPVFLFDDTPANATTGDVFKFVIAVNDNIEIKSVIVDYSYDGTPANAELKISGGATYSKEIMIDPGVDSSITYTFTATDLDDNSNTTEERTIDVIDNDAPKLGADNTPTEATTGDPFTFSINLTDNIGVQRAWANLRQSQKDVLNVTLEKAGGITWTGTGTIPDNIDPILYVISAQDAKGNVRSGPQRRLEVLDNDDPTFGADLSTGEKVAGGRYTFHITVGDNYALEKVLLIYYYGTGDVMNQTMKNITMKRYDNYTYMVNVTLDQSHIEDLTYHFAAKDLNMRWGHSPSYKFSLIDETPPFLPTITLKFGLMAGTGRDHRVTMEIVDNIKVQSAEIIYKFGRDGEERSVGMTGVREWTGHIPIPLDYIGNMSFSIRATDHAGNVNQTIFFNASIIDVTPPQLGALNPITITVGESFSVKLNLSDNIDGDHLSIVWKSNPLLPFSLNGTDIAGVVNTPGTYKIDVEVKDSAGNMNTSGFTLWVKEIEIPDVPDEEEANYGPVIAIVVIILLIIVGVAGFFIIKRMTENKRVEEARAEEERIAKEEAALNEAEAKLAEEERKQKEAAKLYGSLPTGPTTVATGPLPPSAAEFVNIPPPAEQAPTATSAAPSPQPTPGPTPPAPTDPVAQPAPPQQNP